MQIEKHHTSRLVEDALQLIETEASEAIRERGEFRLSLSGGNTPKPVYEAMAQRPFDWQRILFTFGDERCVPPDDPRSNYHMVKNALFAHVPIPKENILRMHGEEEPATAALDYEDALKRRSPHEIFVHDLIILGMGPDGHTASLFPGTPALEEQTRWVVSNYVPQMEMWRLTFTYPLIAAARHVCFLLSKKGKENVLEDIEKGRGNYPCTHIKPLNGRITWLIGE